MLAVQGPDAPELLGSVLGHAPGRFRVEDNEFRGTSIIVSGTGYTGERGAELIAPLDVGEELLDALLQEGAGPCGLGSRDTLRLEMGYPLWGQDLDEATSPLEADLGWVVNWDHDFVGKSALENHRDNGVAKLLVGFTTEGRRFARHGYPARADESRGVVASRELQSHPRARNRACVSRATSVERGELGGRDSWRVARRDAGRPAIRLPLVTHH